MAALITALVIKNEAGNFLERVLTDCARYSDQLLVLDDCSSDASRTIAKRCGAIVRTRRQGDMWGKEAPARRELWDWGAAVAKDGWLLICDADQLLDGDPRPYIETDLLNTWCFHLYDLWDSETSYRADGYWKAHTVPRPWLFCPSRVMEGWVADWSSRGIHTGHCPQNWPMLAGIATDLAWHHLAYVDRNRRRRKLEAYQQQFQQMSPFEIAHATSIGDS